MPQLATFRLKAKKSDFLTRSRRFLSFADETPASEINVRILRNFGLLQNSQSYKQSVS